MPRYLEFTHKETNRADVYRAYRKETDIRLKERYHAILLGLDGRSCSEIAEILYRDENTIRTYARAFRERGLAGLAMKQSPGRPPRLTPEDRDELKKILRMNPRDVGYTKNVWTVRLVMDWLKKNRGIDLKHERLRQILRELDPQTEKSEQFYLKIGENIWSLPRPAVIPRYNQGTIQTIKMGYFTKKRGVVGDTRMRKIKIA